MYRRYWITLGIMALFTPLGLLAEGTAWGEWAAEDLAKLVGFVPWGISQAVGLWQALSPDYKIAVFGQGRIADSAGYVISAFVGAGLVYLVTLACIKLMMRTGPKS